MKSKRRKKKVWKGEWDGGLEPTTDKMERREEMREKSEEWASQGRRINT